MKLSKNKSTLFLSFLWVVLPGLLTAQSIYEQIGRLPTTTYSVEEMGALTPTFWTTTQSDEGLMYFGSTGGLFEYDGVSWRRIFQNPIRILAKDPSDRIYYGGRDFGYLEVDSNGETQAISLLNLIPKELQENFQIWTIHFLNNSIFIQTKSHIIRLDLEEDFSLKSLKSWPAETAFTLAFLIGEDYYVSQNEKGLYRLTNEELKLVPRTEVLGQDQISIMLPLIGDKRGEFLIGMFNTGFYLLSEDGIKRFPTQVDKLVQKGSQLYRASVQNGNYVLSVIDGGVIIMSPRGEILKKIDSSQGLPSDFITSTYQDLGGGLWITTDDGIARVAINSPVQTFGKENGINSTVKSIQKKGNDFFLGTNNGLVKFDSVSKSFKTQSNFNTGQIWDLKYDGENLLIAANRIQQIQKGNPVLLDFPENSGIAYSFLIPKNSPNLLYVGTSTGLLVYRRGLSKEPSWEYEGKVPGIGSVGGYLTEDKVGKIFVPSFTGVFRFDPSKTDLVHGELDKNITKVQEMDINGSWSLINGDYYSFSKEGWKKYADREGEFVPADEFQALQGEMIDLTQHQSGIIWMESKNGKKYILKRQEDGTYAKDETPNSIAPYLSYVDFIDEDSIMWFGNPKGLIRYDPKKDNQSDKKFFTLIRRIETKTDTLPLIAYGRDKSLPAREMKDNSYRFEFAAPYFEEEKKTKYQTFLEGFDADWVDWNDNRFKEYTNLSLGTYTFRVRAMAYTGRISEEAVYSFVVLPPWYATWWAYLIFALLIGGIITAIVKWRSRKLQAENQILEERVKERTAELEKSYQNVELLGEIGRKITSSLSAEKIITTVYANVNALMEASVLGIGIYHEETQTLEFPATYENGEALTPYSNSLQDPNRLSALCFNTGNEIVINNLNEEYSKYLQKMPTPSRGLAPVSLIYLPLKVKGKRFGVITVQSFNKNAFNDYHLYMLRTIAVYTAIALENAESYQNLRQTLNSLKDTQDQLIHTEKMASLGELTAGIAHEIQNPLNFVNNFAEISSELLVEMKDEFKKGEIEEGFAIADDIKQNLEKIHHHGKRADAIVKGMLAHSRKSAGEKEPTDINALADEYLRLSYHGLRAKDKSFNSDFKTDFDPTIPKVNVVPQDIGRVLLNIINNAFQALNNGELRMKNEGFKPLVTVSTKNLGDKIQISITDNGTGIPEAIKDKIFQPFFTTKPTGQGTGLGLSLSYDIVKAHGGEIRLESQLGEGSTFVIELPIA